MIIFEIMERTIASDTYTALSQLFQPRKVVLGLRIDNSLDLTD